MSEKGRGVDTRMTRTPGSPEYRDEPFHPTGCDRLPCSDRAINLVCFRANEQTRSGKNEFISSEAESSSY